MNEPIRLVIWDLDETFWRGTLTEGGIREYVQEHHQIIIELAKRGIISSICSKNEHEAVEKILQEYKIWDYFVFPSIDWTPKGPRLQALIEDIQLRSETVLFIDDNASNRAEASACVPGLQVADESIIPTLLTHELCQGKNDIELTRLKQYQLLQRRKQDEKKAGANNLDFLRASRIRVIIKPDVSEHLDRIIELINRTNQLNFTKIRLSDDKQIATNELNKLIKIYFCQAGLVRVKDNYGDYGFCGFYLMRSIHEKRQLIHFCFSCRILGMGIERWLFQRLGSPIIQIKGETQADLTAKEKIDWINQELDGSLLFADGESDLDLTLNQQFVSSNIPEIRVRGGCELDALSHYLQQETAKLVPYTNYPRGTLLMRLDNTTNIGLALSPLNDSLKQELNALTLNENDFNDEMFSSAIPSGSLFVISTWGDLYLPVYRHKSLDFEICIALHRPGTWDLTRITPEQLEKYFAEHPNFFIREEKKEHAKQIVKQLATHYTFMGLTNETSIRNNLLKLFGRIPKNSLLAFILPSCYRGDASSTALFYHSLVKDVAKHFPNVFTLDISQFIQKTEDIQDAVDHFDRMVYFNLYKTLLQTYAQHASLAIPTEIQ